MMAVYYVEHDLGCGLKSAADEHEALARVRRDLGASAGQVRVSEATEDEISWVAAFGGYLPAEAKQRLAQAGTEHARNGDVQNAGA